MRPTDLIEVPVHYRAVPVRPLSPFHWALLRALQTFAPGRRPDLDELTRRLEIGVPAFLNEAWRDLLGWRTVDDPIFAQARLTLEGEEALREGACPLGAAVAGSRRLYFSSEGAWLVPARAGTARLVAPLNTLPAWSGQVTAREAERFFRTTAGADPVRADERWQGVRLAWAEARVVTFAPPARTGQRS